MKKHRGESKTEQELTEYLVRTKAFYLYVLDNYDKLCEANDPGDLDYALEIFKSIYEHGMEEGFISFKQKNFIDGLIRRMTVLVDEDDILDRVDPGTLTYDIEEE
ncbi:MAG: hypothetical protein JXB88_22925 [Spirochaetales bacterium]|nr:hypothetical protein [Spirochaetales bacterium]